MKIAASTVIDRVGQTFGSMIARRAAAQAAYAQSAEPVRVVKGNDDGTVDIVRWSDELCAAHSETGASEEILLSGDPAVAPRCAAWRFTVGRAVKVGSAEIMARHHEATQNVTNELLGTGTGTLTEFYTDHAPVSPETQVIRVDGVLQTENVDYVFDAEAGRLHFKKLHVPDEGAEVRADYTYYAWPVGSMWLALYSGDADKPTTFIGTFDLRSAHFVGYSVQILLYFDANVYDGSVEGFDLVEGTYYWLALCSNDPAETSPPTADRWDGEALYLRVDPASATGRTLIDTALRHRPDDWGASEYSENDGMCPWFRVFERVSILRGVPLLENTAVPNSGTQAVMQRIGGSHSFRQVINRNAAGSAIRATSSGGSGGGGNIDHQKLANLMGGSASERYHMTADEYGGVWGHAQKAVVSDAATNTVVGCLLAKHLTSGDMVNGFGAAVHFQVEDGGSGEKTLGRFGMVRAGADQTGDFVWSVYSGAAWTERMRLTNAGALSVPGWLNLGANTTATAAGQLGVTRVYFNTTANLDGATAGQVTVTGNIQLASGSNLQWATSYGWLKTGLTGHLYIDYGGVLYGRDIDNSNTLMWQIGSDDGRAHWGVGTAAAPSISFLTYPSSGLWAAAGPIVGMSIAGVEISRWNSAAFLLSSGITLGAAASYIGTSYQTTINVNSTAYLSGATAGKVGVNITTGLATLTVYGTSAPIAASGIPPGDTPTLRVHGSATNVIDFNTSNSSPYPCWVQARANNNAATQYPLALNPAGGVVTVGPGGLAIRATAKLYLDEGSYAGGNTYITESSGDVIDVYAGGVNSLRIDNASIHVNRAYWNATAYIDGAVAGKLNLYGVTRFNNAYDWMTSDGTIYQVPSTDGAGTVTWRSISDGLGLFGTTLGSSAGEQYDDTGDWVVKFSQPITVSQARAMLFATFEAKNDVDSGSTETAKVVIATTAGGTDHATGINLLSGYWQSSGGLAVWLPLAGTGAGTAYQAFRAMFSFAGLAIGATYYINFCVRSNSLPNKSYIKGMTAKVNP